MNFARRHFNVSVLSIALAFASAALLPGCTQGDAAAPLQAAAVDRNTADAVDGMILLDYPGPKGQILYAQGQPDFFCDTVGMFAMYLKPEQQRQVRGVFVQDMAQADWSNPVGHWIDAKSAFYVAGSKAHGAMGATLASFAREDDARAFAAKQGGKVVRFDEVTPEMVVTDGGVVKDKM
jgi:copper chaperone NosL